MITPSFSLTATERVLPRLALDFTTASLDPRVTFTRSGNTATVVNSSGFITAINANLPRFDFNPVTLACNGLLIEESRTNSILYSNDLSQVSAWTISTATLTPNAVVSPDGTQNAATISAAAQNPLAAQFYTIPADAATYCISMYVKYVSGSKNFRLRCALTNGTAVATNIAFNAETGAFVSSSAGAVYTITNAGNGWFRVTLLATNNSTNTRLNFQIYSGNDATVTNSMAVYGCQSEVGAFATSYIPTTTIALTRNRDNVVMTGTNFSDWFSSAAGTFMVGWTQGGYATTSASFILECVGGLRSPQQTFGIRFYGQNGSNVALAGAPTVGATYKVGIGYTNGAGERVAINGGAVSTNGTNYTTAPTSLTLGFSTISNNFAMNGWVRQLNWYQQQLTNAEISAISK
jgi:hypothetical protein